MFRLPDDYVASLALFFYAIAPGETVVFPDLCVGCGAPAAQAQSARLTAAAGMGSNLPMRIARRAARRSTRPRAARSSTGGHRRNPR
jgi:hypothetical protein